MGAIGDVLAPLVRTEGLGAAVGAPAAGKCEELRETLEAAHAPVAAVAGGAVRQRQPAFLAGGVAADRALVELRHHVARAQAAAKSVEKGLLDEARGLPLDARADAARRRRLLLLLRWRLARRFRYPSRGFVLDKEYSYIISCRHYLQIFF